MAKTAIVVGAGIVGLAAARALATRGYAVTVIDRNERAVGASIRNFGMVWPVGQPDGPLFQRAMLSREIWRNICEEAGIWYDPVGSLHVAHDLQEMLVLEELATIYHHRGYQLLNYRDTIDRSPAVASPGLMGSLYSPHELIVDPRMAIARIPAFFESRYGVRFIWGKAVTQVNHPAVRAGNEIFEADEIYVCSGADFETLYPAAYSEMEITRCKLQMMRLAVQPDQWRIGPALCGGLSLVHYQSFKAASSLLSLQQQFHEQYPQYLKWGIHVMISQNQQGELTVGDSHEYGMNPDPFDRLHINQLILAYLTRFAKVKNMTISETWNGVYPKMTNGETHVVLQPDAGVTIINGLGGAGMTLSFGLCDELIGKRAVVPVFN